MRCNLWCISEYIVISIVCKTFLNSLNVFKKYVWILASSVGIPCDFETYYSSPISESLQVLLKSFYQIAWDYHSSQMHIDCILYNQT